VITLADLRPGDIGFARHVLPRSADLLILASQLALGEPGYPHHVFVVTGVGAPWVGDRYGSGTDVQSSFQREGSTPTVKIVQAMPSGAEEIEIGAEFWTKDYTYIRPAYGTRVAGIHAHAPLDFVQGVLNQDAEVALKARGYVGTPYSFADYAAIAGVHFGIANGPIRRYVTSSKHMICSQLADQAMSDAGWHVFNDGRLPQDVTPAALHAQMRKMPGQFLVPELFTQWMPNEVGFTRS
jgi:hypothetical protein